MMIPALEFDSHSAPSFATRLCAIAGAICLVAGAVLSPASVWPYLLLLSYALVGLGVGALSFIALQYIVGSGWAAAFRRVPEAMIAVLPLGFVGLWIVFLAHPSLYPWQGAAHDAAPGLAWFKQAWLSWPFFLVRAAVYMALWAAFGYAMLRHSRKQDETGDVSHTKSNIHLSAGFLAVFGITSFLASVDWIMSLEPHWYSTMFGWYNFAGQFESALAVIILLVVWLERRGPLRGVINEAHLHDLGKLLFAFSTFWMYLWFSQYLLIWYSNIPEETVYFTARLRGWWMPFSMASLLLNWVVPFVVLMTIPVKRNASALTKVAVAVLVGRWFDLYLMIFPSQSPDGPVFGIWEAGMTIGAIAAVILVVRSALGAANIIPKGDPYIRESLHHH